MYHRYIPSADGGYLCQKIPEPPQTPPEPPRGPAPKPPPEPQAPPEPTPSLLRRLLPQGLETDDLLILLILLLLVLDGDGDDDLLTVFLALAAYLLRFFK